MAARSCSPSHCCKASQVAPLFNMISAEGSGWPANEGRAYGQVSDVSGMEVVSGCKHHHDQAEGEDGFHAPRLPVVHAWSQLVCTAPNCCEGVGIDLHRIGSIVKTSRACLRDCHRISTTLAPTKSMCWHNPQCDQTLRRVHRYVSSAGERSGTS